MEVSVNNILGAEGYPQSINYISAAGEADVAGNGKLLITINLSHLVKIAEKDECDGGQALGKLQPLVDDGNTTPEKWVKTMAAATEQAACKRQQYGQVLGELTGYLESKGGVFLKKDEASNG